MVTDYLEGGLVPAVHTAVDGHLRGCLGCIADVGQLRATVAAVRTTPPPSVDPEFCARLVAAFRDWSAQPEIVLAQAREIVKAGLSRLGFDLTGA